MAAIIASETTTVQELFFLLGIGDRPLTPMEQYSQQLADALAALEPNTGEGATVQPIASTAGPRPVP